MAVNGFALGGGCEIAMAGDILIASENAKFGQPEVNLGLIPGYGGSQRTTRLIGKGMATYLCLTGEMIDAREALRIGLVQRVVPLADLMNEAKRIANAIASKAPLAIAACKRVDQQRRAPFDRRRARARGARVRNARRYRRHQGRHRRVSRKAQARLEGPLTLGNLQSCFDSALLIASAIAGLRPSHFART